MGKLIDADRMKNSIEIVNPEQMTSSDIHKIYELKKWIDCQPTIEAIPKDNVYKAIQEMMKYEHEGFINISLARLDEILKKCGVCEDGRN